MGSQPLVNRRTVLAGVAAGALLARAAAAQHGAPLPQAPSSTEPFAALRGGGAPHHLTPDEAAQRVTQTPAPSGPPGRWVARAPLPLPRSEMAWATAWAGRMHIVGGYGEGRVDRAYHHVYDPSSDTWFSAAPLPRGANHVAGRGGRRPCLCARRLPGAEPQPGLECLRLRCGG